MANRSDILETTQLEKVAGGFVFTEGPLWHPDDFWYFVDIRQNLLYRMVLGQKPEVVRQTSLLWRKHHLDYDQTKYVVERVRRRLGLAAPATRPRTVERPSWRALAASVALAALVGSSATYVALGPPEAAPPQRAAASTSSLSAQLDMCMSGGYAAPSCAALSASS